MIRKSIDKIVFTLMLALASCGGEAPAQEEAVLNAPPSYVRHQRLESSAAVAPPFYGMNAVACLREALSVVKKRVPLRDRTDLDPYEFATQYRQEIYDAQTDCFDRLGVRHTRR